MSLAASDFILDMSVTPQGSRRHLKGFEHEERLKWNMLEEVRRSSEVAWGGGLLIYRLFL